MSIYTSAIRIHPSLNQIYPTPRKLPTPPRSRVLFNAAQNSPATRETTEGSEDVPTLQWEASVATDVVTLGSLGYKITLPDPDEQDEDDGFQFEEFRVTHTERIFGDDGESFVDVEVIDQIGFRNRTDLVRKFLLESVSRIRAGVPTI